MRCCVFLILAFTTMASDCEYNPNSVIICPQYCLMNYARPPQRAYYNFTSKNCEPVRYCRQRNSAYYDYDTNKCYVSNQNRTELASYYPQTVQVQPTVSKFKGILCINGILIGKVNSVIENCVCQPLWINSDSYDMNGYKFKCDKVTDNPKSFFLGNLQFDQNGTITKYGALTSSQMSIVLANLKIKQRKQQLEYMRNNSYSVLYAVNKYTQQEPIIRYHQIPFFVIFLLAIYICATISYRNYRDSKLLVNEEEFLIRLQDVIKEENVYRIR